ncbi:methionyl-tRNA formyltransferase [Sneathiella sp. CAU 1612]|uniref:Methionyl-tRNA formyltransferase n=1 Tax=Sneathiella sedimenti TaxID=2816034 RepID=A0ABS3F1S8_9PROT|nr:methionyl-tRNA formyltransferase [Sneathiella sedimenti]MBO0332349.1 methionyl-tRNA formyltransferase [Sneathiella sedimenti]
MAGLRLAFMGTPMFSAHILTALIGSPHEVACVYSQPPRPAGRGKKLVPSAVHQLANSEGVPVRTPVSLKSPEVQAEFADLKLDVAIVVAYGLILPSAILDAPKFGCLNLHASLLPRWRGAAPIQRAIMAGDEETGIAVMQMEAGLDTGPVLSETRVPINAETTAGSLHDVLAETGAELLLRTLARLEAPDLVATPQSSEGVTYAEKISKSEAKIDWRRSAIELDRHIRGLNPAPGAYFEYQGQRIKLLAATPVEGEGGPGTVLDDRLTVACGEGALRLITLQPAGKGAMDAASFLNGRLIAKGEVLG